MKTTQLSGKAGLRFKSTVWTGVLFAVATSQTFAQTGCAPPSSGLISWWRGDGNTSDELLANPGTNVGNATFGPGRVGQGFVLDGLDDGVNIGNSASLQLQNFSIEGWIKRAHPTRATQSAQTSGYLFGGPSGGYGFGLLDDGRLFLAKNGASAVFAVVAVMDTNAFHHVAVTKTGSTVVVYVDGVAEAIGPYDPGFTFAGPMAIGARGGDYAASFYGTVDEISVYNRALDSGEIQSIFNAGITGKCAIVIAPAITSQPTNQSVAVGASATFSVTATGTEPLIYQWRLNETNLAGATAASLTLTNVQLTNAGNYSLVVTNNGGAAISSNALLFVIPPPACASVGSGLVGWWPGAGNPLDSVGTNHGTLVGDTTYVPGRVGQAFVMDGAGDRVTVGNPPSLQIQDFTIETWIKRSSTTAVSFGSFGNGVIFGYGSGGYGLYLDPNGTPNLSKIGLSATAPATTITDTNIHHLAVTKSGSTVIFYVDGTAFSASAYNPGFTFTTIAAIGARGDNGDNSFLGVIDEMSIYNRALSTNEIQAIYNAGAVGKCAAPPVIVTHPQNRTVMVGANVTFTVATAGTQPFSYQWRFNATNLAGATGGSLTLTNVQLTNTGNYSVAVSNVAGGNISSNAMLSAVTTTPPCASPPVGLVSWWAAENNALDQTDGNHGAKVDDLTHGPGRVGIAFVSDGNGDGINVGNPTNLQMQNFTIEAWIKRASPTKATQTAQTSGVIFSGPTGAYGLGIGDDGKLLLSKIGISAVTSANAITDTTNFHHVAVTKSGSNVFLYIDGLGESVGPYDPGFTFSGFMAIGARGGDFGSGFYGSIDEVSIYNRALSAGEIQAIFNAGALGKCTDLVSPFIVTHPQNTNTIAGNIVSFSVLAGGTATLDYQWRLNGTNLAGATGATLVLSNAQVSQSGSYSVLVTNGMGSVLSSNATLTVAFPTAVVRLGGTNAMAGGPVTVPVTLAASGNENGLGLSVNFNTQRLAFASATLGGGGAGATLLVNTTMISTGRVGIAVAFPPHLNFAPGTQEVARLTFNSLPLLGGAAANATNSFADQPILRELYDAQLQSLPAFYSNGIVTLLPSVFEADVSPRPGGNQGLSGTDWSQAGRFAARLDAAAAGGEFQRADCAPRGTLGDGKLKITDWVQAGRYLAGLDPLTAVGGPTNETAAVSDSAPVSRQLRVAGTNGLQAEMVHVPVVLEAQGNENALGFTVAYPLEAFVFAGIAPGSGAGGATLILNTNQAGAGRVGVALGLAVGGVFAAGAKELVRVSLLPLPGVAGALPVTLSDALVTRCVSDAGANELPVNYADGVVAISPADPRPPLWIAVEGTNVVLSWPLWAAEFALQTVADTGASGGWTNQPIELETNAWRVSGTLPADADAQFFRLFRP